MAPLCSQRDQKWLFIVDQAGDPFLLRNNLNLLVMTLTIMKVDLRDGKPNSPVELFNKITIFHS